MAIPVTTEFKLKLREDRPATIEEHKLLRKRIRNLRDSLSNISSDLNGNAAALRGRAWVALRSDDEST